MTRKLPTTRTVKVAEIEAVLLHLVDEVSANETRVILEKAGTPVAALVSADDLRRLQRMDEEDRRAWAVLEAMRAPFRGVPPEEIEREAAKADAEIRAENRARRAAAAGRP
jgi:prevent-host-death family protein